MCSCVRVMFVATGRVVGGMGVSSAQCWHSLQCSFVGASKSVGGCRFVRCDLSSIVVLPCPLRVPLFRRLWR